MPLTVLDHPVAAHLLTLLRDARTEPAQFRALCRQVTLYLLVEATADLPVRSRNVDTPLETAEGAELAAELVVVPILRAGLGMLEAATQFLPRVAVGYVGLERDETTAVARSYYCKLPPVKGREVLLIDPMLATGGSANHALDLLAKEGAAGLRVLSIVAAPEGVEAVRRRHPGALIFTAALDRELDARKYIRPGLGDFGDRLYGT